MPEIKLDRRSGLGRDWLALGFLAFWALAVVIALWIGARRMFVMLKRVGEDEQSQGLPLPGGKEEKRRVNRLHILDKFRLWDREGEEITKMMTPKLRQIFLMVLINQYYFERRTSSNALSEVIWPMIPKDKSNNSRSIAMKRIRGILERLDGISLKFEGNGWKLIVAEDFSCDFLSFCEEMKYLKRDLDSRVAFDRFRKSLKDGLNFPEQKNDWLEKAYSEIISEVVSLTLDRYAAFADKMDLQEEIALAEAILKIDELEDQALKIKLRALSKLDSHAKVHAFYNQFVAKYKDLYAEDYPNSLEEILETEEV